MTPSLPAAAAYLTKGKFTGQEGNTQRRKDWAGTDAVFTWSEIIAGEQLSWLPPLRRQLTNLSLDKF